MEYSSKSSKKYYWKKFFFLIITWIIVAIGVGLLSAWMMGYSFNREMGSIEQGGILQIGSRPTDATVSINGRTQIRTTNFKYVGLAGEYALELTRDNYRPWQKTVPVLPGRITWATYARLIPEKIEPEDVLSLPDTLVGALPSGSSRYYAMLFNEENKPSMSIVQIDGEEVNEVEKEIPESILSTGSEGSVHQYEMISWSGDERQILVKHTYDDVVEWIIVDRRNPENSTNLSTLLGLRNIEDVTFANNDGSTLYGVVDGGLRLLNADRGSISRPHVNNVDSYGSAGSGYITYVTKPNEEGIQEIGYTKTSFDEAVVLQSIEAVPGSTVLIDIAKYYDNWYVLVGQGRNATLYSIPRLPDDPRGSIALTTVAEMNLTHQLTDVRFAASGQLAIIEDGYSFSTYNLEIKQLNSTTLEGDVDEPRIIRHLDSHLLWTDDGNGTLRTYEFDGANQNNIMPAIVEFDAVFSPSAKYLYTIREVEEGYELTRAQFLNL